MTTSASFARVVAHTFRFTTATINLHRRSEPSTRPSSPPHPSAIIMSPEAPCADSGDTNEQVRKNFSRTPGLTPVSEYPALSTMFEALHMRHGLPFLKNSGMKLAGSRYWTSCEERPHTLLLVIELHKADRLRWRDIDADARKLLRDYEMEDSCYLRYYIAREPEDARSGIESQVEASRGLDESRTSSSPPERASTPSSLADLIPISPEARSATAAPAPLSRQQRRHRRREIATRAQQSARTRQGRNDSSATAIPRPSAFSTPPSLHAALTARPNEPSIGQQRRARQPQESPWRPTDEELSRFRNHPSRYTAIVDERASSNGRSRRPSGSPREWTASGNTWLDYFAASLQLEDVADGPID